MELRRMLGCLLCLLLFCCASQAPVRGRLLTKDDWDESTNRRALPETAARSQVLEVEKYLSSVNRPFVESHVLSDGSTVDCVKIEDQLALQHPLLRDHTVLTKPSTYLVEDLSSHSATTKEPNWQLFHNEKGGCPSGTIPVRRIQKKDVQRFVSPDGSHKKYFHNSTVQAPLGSLSTRESKFELPSASGSHQYAIVEASGTFSGALSFISTWAPYVASYSDFSLSQLWVGTGSGSNINTVEVGWQVYPLLTGDYRPHLFIYWTSDSYSSTGCYNLRCPAFVQISPTVLLGGAISGISSPGSSVFRKFLVYKDPLAWWLQIDGIWVGYWPALLFGNMQTSAQWIQWGGEVCLTAPNSGTDMGSGFFPSAGTTRAASHNSISSVDGTLNRQDARNLFTFTSDNSRYAAQVQYRTNQGTDLLYGGPGL